MRILLTGGEGMLARALVAGAAARGHDVVALSRARLDVTDAAAVRSAVRQVTPAAVVQCAGWTRVDDAEADEAGAHAVNAQGTHHVAEACREAGARLVYPSTDYVFDGSAAAPYAPAAEPVPVSAYGRSKLAGERAAALADALIVRTSWLYGRGGRHFIGTIVRRGRETGQLRVVDDQTGAPTRADDLAQMIVVLLERAAPAGIWHATNTGQTTWYGLARAALDLTRVEAEVTPVSSAAYPLPAPRPAWSVLDCSATYAVTGEAPHWLAALAGAIDDGLLDD